ncbi:MAG: DEAD/DEAH box helicase [Patescibacteria group bacterium]|nr:DEAD/DEAH box helicase [Patescibacteria group bacterium]
MKTLRHYQHDGKRHLLSMPFGLPHALLADEPGTGKTATAIEAAKEVGAQNGIILCPAIIKEQWARELVTWGLCEPDEIQIVYGLNATIDNRPFKVINYELVREPLVRNQLIKRNWHFLTLDEAHRLKSHDSQQSKAVFQKQTGLGNFAYWKWALSGSIVPNRPKELYPILKTMAPQVLGKYDNWTAYLNRYCGGEHIGGKGATNIDELTAAIQPFMLRRKLKDVWRECPDQMENDVYLDVPFESHPEWIGADYMQESTIRRVVAESKIPFIVAYLKERLEGGTDKLVVFGWHRHVIEELYKQLNKFNPVKIYGGMAVAKRNLSLSKFVTDGTCRLLILQIASGGEGLDGVQAVCHEYVQAEPEWSPGREDQAGRRVLRLGQTETVISTKLLAARSFEDVINGSNKRKRKTIEVILKPNGGTYIMSLEDSMQSIATSLKKFEPIADILGPLLQADVAAQLQQAPIAAPPQQVFAPPAAPQAPPAASFAPPPAATAPAPFAPPPVASAPAPSPFPPAPVAAAAPPAASLPNTAAGTLTREAFANQVMAIYQPRGEQGYAAFEAKLKEYGVSKLSDIPETHFQDFLSRCA